MPPNRFKLSSEDRSVPPNKVRFRLEFAVIAALFAVAAVHAADRVVGSVAAPVQNHFQMAATFLMLALSVALYILMNHRLKNLKAMHGEIEKRGAIDLVSGGCTRSRFLTALQQAISERKNAGSVALIIIDIDHFKQINDLFGHPAGDEVLGFCTRIARETFEGGTVGRLGGDELAVLLSHDEVIPDSFLAAQCDHYLEQLRDGLFVNNRRQSVSASMGIALAPTHSSNSNELLSFADMALYQAKRAGRGGWSIFSTEILADMRQERFIERELRAAILLKQLTVHYQPIVDGDGKPTSVEALVRWNNPVRGMISPAEFIPVAEKTRLIHDLGLFVLQKVCDDIDQLPDVPINVNISAWQLRHDAFLRDYSSVLARNDTPASRFILEITESAMLKTSDAFVERMSEIKAAGFLIALDDFGMGYSEFNQLRRLPFDIIKIDKSFIQNIGTDVVTDTFVSAVTQIAGEMNRLVVAEGIETKDDNLRASVAGCRLFQGYYYQAPVALEQLTGMYADAEPVQDAA